MAKPIIKTNLKGSDKIELKYNGREVDMTLSDFKLYLDEVLEPTNAVLTSTEPLRYKALLSQNAPIASTLNVNMVAGQIWTLETYSALDMSDPFDSLELISGIIRVPGSKYRSNVNLTINFSTTEMSYDGSPYVVSTDSNGNFNPLINTLGENPTYSYNGAGDYRLNVVTPIFINSKSFMMLGQNVGGSAPIDIIWNSNNNLAIETPIDDILNYTSVEIEVYP